MKVFVPECVRHFLFLCLTNVNDIYLFMSVLFLSFIAFSSLLICCTQSKLMRVGG